MSPTAESCIGWLVHQTADALLSVLLAPSCAACNSPLASPTTGPVCEACWSTVRAITPPVCDACGDPLPAWRPVSRERGLCPRCRRTRRAIDRGRSIGAYDGTLREIVHALKYGRRRSLAPRLAELMRERGADLLRDADCVVPVPLHPRRQRSRGFNQARELARHLELPLIDALARIHHTRPQVELPAGQRHANVRHAFALSERSFSLSLVNACVVLVDDVSTTGATLEACARVLKGAGVREVRALTAARVVARRL